MFELPRILWAREVIIPLSALTPSAPDILCTLEHNDRSDTVSSFRGGGFPPVINQRRMYPTLNLTRPDDALGFPLSSTTGWCIPYPRTGMDCHGTSWQVSARRPGSRRDRGSSPAALRRVMFIPIFR